MQRLVSLLAATLAFALALPSAGLAATRYVGDLTDGALLGPVTSSAQLQTDFQRHGELIAKASRQLGLAPSEYREVREAVAGGRARYVTIPRHLDGMAGEHGGVAFAVHDIEIPANVHGWEVDIARPDGVVRVFVPNACGNISYLLVPRARQLAAVTYHRPAPVAVAMVTPPPAPPPPVDATPAPAPLAPVALPTAAPQATHRTGLWPLLALIPLFFIPGGSSVSLPVATGGGIPPVAPPMHLRITTAVLPSATPCPPSVARGREHRP